MGADSLFTIVNSWHKQVSFLKETLCWDLLTRSSFNRTLRFEMHRMGMYSTQAEQPVNTTYFREQFSVYTPFVFRPCTETAGKHLVCEPRYSVLQLTIVPCEA